MYHTKFQKVPIDLSKMETCDACKGKPIFFCKKDLVSHQDNYHKTFYQKELVEIRNEMKRLSDILTGKEQIVGVRKNSVKPDIHHLQQQQIKIEQSMSKTENEIRALENEYECKVSTIYNLQQQLDDITYSLDYKQKVLSALHQQRRKIDEEYLKTKHSFVAMSPLEAWKLQCEAEARFCSSTLFKGSRAHERGEENESLKRIPREYMLKEDMDCVINRINHLENDMVTLKKKKSMQNVHLSTGKHEQEEIQEKLDEARKMLSTKDHELLACKTEIKVLQEKLSDKESVIVNLQNTLQLNEVKMKKYKKHLATQKNRIAELHEKLNETKALKEKVEKALQSVNIQEKDSGQLSKVISSNERKQLNENPTEKNNCSDLLDRKLQNGQQIFEKNETPLNETMASLYQQNREVNEEMKKLNEAKNEKDAKYNRLKEKFKDLKRFEEEKIRELEKLKKESALLSERDKELEMAKQKLLTLTAQNDILSQQKTSDENKLKSKLYETEQLLNEKIVELQKCEVTHAVLEKTLEEMRVPKLMSVKSSISPPEDQDKVASNETDRLSSLLDEYKNQNDDLTASINTFKTEVEKLKSEIHETKVELSETKERKEELTKEKDKSNSILNDYDKLRKQMSDSQTQLNQISEEKTDIENNCQNLKNELKALVQLHASCVANKNKLNEENKILNEKYKELEQTCKTHNDELENVRNLINVSENATAQYCKLNTQLKITIDSLETQLESKTTQLEQQSTNISSLKETIHQLKGRQDDTNVINLKLSERIENEGKMYTQIIEGLKQRLEKETKAKDDLEQKYMTQEIESSKMKKEFDEMMKEMEQCKKKNAVLAEQMFSNSRDFDNCCNQIKELQTENQEKNNLIKQLQLEVESLQNQLKQVNDKKDGDYNCQMEILSKEIEEKSRLINEVKHDLDERDAHVKTHKKEILEIKTKLVDTERLLALTKDNLINDRVKYAEFELINKKQIEIIENLRKHLNETTERSNEREKEDLARIVALNKEIESCTTNLKYNKQQATNEKYDLNQHISNLQNELKVLQQQMDDMKTQHTHAENKQKELMQQYEQTIHCDSNLNTSIVRTVDEIDEEKADHLDDAVSSGSIITKSNREMSDLNATLDETVSEIDEKDYDYVEDAQCPDILEKHNDNKMTSTSSKKTFIVDNISGDEASCHSISEESGEICEESVASLEESEDNTDDDSDKSNDGDNTDDDSNKSDDDSDKSHDDGDSTSESDTKSCFDRSIEDDLPENLQLEYPEEKEEAVTAINVDDGASIQKLPSVDESPNPDSRDDKTIPSVNYLKKQAEAEPQANAYEIASKFTLKDLPPLSSSNSLTSVKKIYHKDVDPLNFLRTLDDNKTKTEMCAFLTGSPNGGKKKSKTETSTNCSSDDGDNGDEQLNNDIDELLKGLDDIDIKYKTSKKIPNTRRKSSF